MGKKINQLLKGQIATSVFFLVLGLCLVLVPVGTVNVICKVIFGLLLIATGLYHVIIFLMEKEGSTLLNLFSGVIVLVIGGFLFANPQIVVKLLPVMLGAFILVDSVWTIRGCLKLNKKGLETWKVFLVESLVFIVLGMVLMFYGFQEVRTMLSVAGWTFLCNGVLDIVFFILLGKGLKKEIPGQDEMPMETEAPQEVQQDAMTEEYEEWKMPSPEESAEKYSSGEPDILSETLPADSSVAPSDEKTHRQEALPEKNEVEVISASDVSVEESGSGK